MIRIFSGGGAAQVLEKSIQKIPSQKAIFVDSTNFLGMSAPELLGAENGSPLSERFYTGQIKGSVRTLFFEYQIFAKGRTNAAKEAFSFFGYKVRPNKGH